MGDRLIRLRKREIRKLVQVRFAQLNDDERLQMSRCVCQRVASLLSNINSQIVMLYSALPDEVDVSSLMSALFNAGKRIVLPETDTAVKRIVPRAIANLNADLKIGVYGIREPKAHCAIITPTEIDLVIVPGRAFDERCYRLGRGAGYYDRFLKLLRSDAVTIGVAFEFQVFPNLPTASHDVPVSYVVTESRILKRKNGKTSRSNE